MSSLLIVKPVDLLTHQLTNTHLTVEILTILRRKCVWHRACRLYSAPPFFAVEMQMFREVQQYRTVPTTRQHTGSLSPESIELSSLNWVVAGCLTKAPHLSLPGVFDAEPPLFCWSNIALKHFYNTQFPENTNVLLLRDSDLANLVNYYFVHPYTYLHFMGVFQNWLFH